MPPTMQPVTPSNVAHLHKWKWARHPDAVYGLWVQTQFVSVVHCFDLKLKRPDEPTMQVAGLGGITTLANERGKGYCSLLMEEVAKELSEIELDGLILNGREENAVWASVGFRDIGESHTAPRQRLWYRELRPIDPGHSFTIIPEGFHW